jgi:hypothetical protein
MKNKMVAIRITEREKVKLDILKHKHCLSISELFRKLINDTYEKMEREA